LSQADQADDVTIKITVIVTTVVIQCYVKELLSKVKPQNVTSYVKIWQIMQNKFLLEPIIVKEWVSRPLDYKVLQHKAWLYFQCGVISPNHGCCPVCFIYAQSSYIN